MVFIGPDKPYLMRVSHHSLDPCGKIVLLCRNISLGSHIASCVPVSADPFAHTNCHILRFDHRPDEWQFCYYRLIQCAVGMKTIVLVNFSMWFDINRLGLNRRPRKVIAEKQKNGQIAGPSMPLQHLSVSFFTYLSFPWGITEALEYDLLGW